MTENRKYDIMSVSEKNVLARSGSGELDHRLQACDIIAVDFDGTLCEDAFPGIGQPNWPLILFLKEKQREGSKLILWTCRCGNALNEAVSWCKKHGLVFDAVNANVPENILQHGGSDSRKIYADIYIDDRAEHWACICQNQAKEA